MDFIPAYYAYGRQKQAVVIYTQKPSGALMKKWEGRWSANNIMLDQLYGKSGTETVYADSEEQAKSEIRCKVSRDLVGTTMMNRSITVNSIKEIKGSGYY